MPRESFLENIQNTSMDSNKQTHHAHVPVHNSPIAWHRATVHLLAAQSREGDWSSPATLTSHARSRIFRSEPAWCARGSEAENGRSPARFRGSLCKQNSIQSPPSIGILSPLGLHSSRFPQGTVQLACQTSVPQVRFAENREMARAGTKSRRLASEQERASRAGEMV
jgi:hypothetical protein